MNLITIAKQSLVLACLALLFGCRSPAGEDPALAAERAARGKLDQAAWLTGIWYMARPDGSTQEQWAAPAGGAMLGLGYTIADDVMTAFEYLRIQTRDGELIYVAHPDGNSPGVEFRLTELTDSMMLFENPMNEFPTWIRYERTGPKSCVATVGGAGEQIEFFYEQ